MSHAAMLVHLLIRGYLIKIIPLSIESMFATQSDDPVCDASKRKCCITDCLGSLMEKG